MRNPGRIVRYCGVGGAVALSYVLFFEALRRLGLGKLEANAIAFSLAVLLQYVGQTALTFRQRLVDKRQILRFAMMIGCGLATSSLMATRFAPALGLSDWMTAVLIVCMLPVQNFVLMSAWVFARHRAMPGEVT